MEFENIRLVEDNVSNEYWNKYHLIMWFWTAIDVVQYETVAIYLEEYDSFKLVTWMLWYGVN